MFRTGHEFDPVKPTIVIKADFGPDTDSGNEMYAKLVKDLKAGVEATYEFLPHENGVHGGFIINLKPAGVPIVEEEPPAKPAPHPIQPVSPDPSKISPPPPPIPPPVKTRTPQEILADSIAKDKVKGK